MKVVWGRKCENVKSLMNKKAVSEEEGRGISRRGFVTARGDERHE